ncbi:outer membrane autotransporter barrel domain-containing protein [Bosea lathyri]|uniref:Outer membrane autotransporter barrel domain-containing protein n=2 Tax=Bosea lathyri TaxID=1036778 RepID=A0A1H5ZHJ1_9HYPH|nr:outer membrane autotransporter barrel domain-containing protein [Bosea lathyri]
MTSAIVSSATSGLRRGWFLSTTALAGLVMMLPGAGSYAQTVVDDGTLVVSSDAQLGGSSVTVDNAADKNATLQINAGVSIGNEIIVNNGGTLSNAGTLSRMNAGQAGVLSMTGGATVHNLQDAVIAGQTQGVLLLGGGTLTNTGGTITGTTLDGAAFGPYGTVTNTLGGTIKGKRAGVLIFGNGTVTNAGGTITGTDVSGVQIDSGTISNTLGGTITGRDSGVTLNAGGTVINDADSTIEAPGGHAVSSVVGNVSLSNAGKLIGSVTLRSNANGDEVHGVTLFTGSSITGNLRFGANAASTLTLDGTGAQLYSTAVGGTTTFDTGTLIKQGSGTWVLNKVLTRSGATEVNAGMLVAAVGGSLGSGAVTVDNNGNLDATLQINAGVSIGNEIIVNNGGALNIGGTISRMAVGDMAVRSDQGGATVNIASTGRIEAYGIGVSLADGGTVTNSGGTITATTDAASKGVYVYGRAGAVNNLTGGTIEAKEIAVQLNAGGTVTNNSGTIAANWGVYTSGGSGVVANLAGGGIRGGQFGVILDAGGTVTNTGVGSAIGASAADGIGVFVNGDGTVTNEGSIAGGLGGVRIWGAGTVNNTGGTIRVTTDDQGHGVEIVGGLGIVTNKDSGSITGKLYGVSLADGGTITNISSTIIADGMDALAAGVGISGGPGIVTNTGAGSLIKGPSAGVRLINGGTVTNGAGATIQGAASLQAIGGNTTLGNAGALVGNVLLRSASTNRVTLFTGSSITGNLQIGTNAASTLTLDGAGAQLYSTAVSGDTTFSIGTLVKQGSGTWKLDKAMSRSGATQITAGTLVVAHSSGLGAGGDATVSGGTLQFGNGIAGGTYNLAGKIDVTGGSLVLETLAALKVAGNVSFADNTALSIVATAGGPSLQAERVTLASNVAFNLSGLDDANGLDRVVIDTRSGLGGDFGKVTVGGFNGVVDYLTLSTRRSADSKQYLASYGLSWTADNNLAHGTFTLANPADRFDIGATLTDRPANAATGWDGKSLAKAGAGTLVLSSANRYSGATTLDAGKLVVNGSLASTVTVNGGWLGGSGTVGGFAANAGGTVAPGNSIGTLNVSGNVSFAAGSTYQVEINAAGQGDRINTSGSATLAGGTVQVLAEGGSYAASTNYTILTAGGGVSGHFAGVNANLAFLTPSLTYDAQNVILTMARNDTSFGPGSGNFIARTRNQSGIAIAAERLGAGNRVYDTVISATADEARAGFDLLSGEAHAQGVAVAIGESRLVREAILGRLRGPLLVTQGSSVTADFSSDLPTPKGATMLPAPRFEERFAVWGEAVGAQVNSNGDGNAAGLSQRIGGAILGADLKLYDTGASSLTVGVAGGYTRSNFDVDARLSSGRIESGHAALYADARFGAWRLDGGLAYSFGETSLTRQVQLRGFSDRLRSDRDSQLLQAFGEFGYAFRFERFAIEPFAQLALLRISSGSAVEQGGPAALRVSSGEQNLGFATLGLRSEAQLGTMPLFARGLLGWRYGFGELTPQALTAFAIGATPARVHATAIDRNALVAEAGLDWRASQSTTLGLAYSAAIGERSRDHALKGRIDVRF